MGWRESVRKQINKAKSRKAENKESARIYYSNRKLHEQEYEQQKQFGKSLYYSLDENDDCYYN